MRKEVRILFAVAVFLLVAPQRLPAPIVDEEKATPAPEEQLKAKAKHSKKPKSNESQASTRHEASSKQSRFAGAWVGTMPEVPWGNVAVKLVVDQTETTMEWWGAGNSHGTAKATLTGNMLSARFPAGFTTAVWYISPQPDGVTANVRLTAFMNDQTAVFHRTVAESSANKIAR
jgi:hypothetical protein